MNKIMKDYLHYVSASSMILSCMVLLFVCFTAHGDRTKEEHFVKEIIVHCSATPEGKDYTVEQLTTWHRQRGFQTIAYNFIIYRDGSCHLGRPLTMVGAHCKGHNAHSIGICYIGGVAKDGRTPKDTRTEEQRKTIHLLLRELHTRYPQATLHGHREFSNKACPSFDCHEYDYIFYHESV